MNKEMIELVFVIDRSGSMYPLTADTVGGFNATLAKQKAKGNAMVTTVLFNERVTRLHDRLPIAGLTPMSEADYDAGGCTALFDALGESIKHIETVHRYIRDEDVPGHTMFVIMTDGLENASTKYRRQDIKTMISEKQEKENWEFVFLGANIDAEEEAGSIGISRERAVRFRADSVGQELNFKSINTLISDVRMHRPVSADWKADIEADYKARGN